MEKPIKADNTSDLGHAYHKTSITSEEKVKQISTCKVCSQSWNK
jgi:hypothetical protein